jgi:hypothetical protein
MPQSMPRRTVARALKRRVSGTAAGTAVLDRAHLAPAMPNSQERRKTYTQWPHVCTVSSVTSADHAAEKALAGLPATFSYTEARAGGLSDRRLYALRDAGVIEQLGRGLFRRADSAGEADPDLLEIAHRAPRATLCLTTALARHGLSDTIPARIDVALPRGQRRPRTQAPVMWHAFAPDTFDIGRDEVTLTAQTTVGIYSPERCIIDAFRLRHLEGPEVAVEALRRWLRRRGAQPATLLRMARAFPKAEPPLHAALEILQ